MSEEQKLEQMRDQARRIQYQRRDIDRMKRQIEELRMENAHLRAMQPEPLKRVNEEVCDENARLRDDLTRERNRSQMYADLVRAIAVALHGPGYTDASKLAEEVASLRAENEALRKTLRDVATIAHNGGMADLTQWHAMNSIRRLTISAWDRSGSTAEQRRRVDAAIDAAKGGE
jgi:regulator of replication initiation timing